MKESIGYRFQKMSRLYHFTSFNAACKIIKSGKLKFSQSFKLNDLIESNRIVFEHILSEELLEKRNGLLAEAEMQSYQQISFSQDREYEGRSFLGFDLHTMWGLYADKGYGVCLVFDKSMLLNCLEEKSKAYHKSIEYLNNFSNSISLNGDNISSDNIIKH